MTDINSIQGPIPPKITPVKIETPAQPGEKKEESKTFKDGPSAHTDLKKQMIAAAEQSMVASIQHEQKIASENAKQRQKEFEEENNS